MAVACPIFTKDRIAGTNSQVQVTGKRFLLPSQYLLMAHVKMINLVWNLRYCQSQLIMHFISILCL